MEPLNNGYVFILHGNNTVRVFGPFGTTGKALFAAIDAFHLCIPEIKSNKLDRNARISDGKAFRPVIGKLYQVANPRNTLMQERINYVSVATLENSARFGRN